MYRSEKKQELCFSCVHVLLCDASAPTVRVSPSSLLSRVSVHSHKKVVLLTSLLDDKGDACDAAGCYCANAPLNDEIKH